ncbi:hypothetical protein [Aeromicrobium wangtongii]|uniref:hypothetical protein n=1 Tax=Aeromicrobium wangtongii TaxID=2969247 RepID=UPI001E31F41B|nr:hypothetical protein [Aeromicrobium wangtongii]MCD9198658.1 hypothetical protein [Aeromicrobium wangtongii]
MKIYANFDVPDGPAVPMQGQNLVLDAAAEGREAASSPKAEQALINVSADQSLFSVGLTGFEPATP